MNTTDENGQPMIYWGGVGTVANITAARIESGTPAAYRLMEKLDGTHVLQGAYQWRQGIEGGHEWRDIETVKETP
jgi:hypothetical protein